VPADSATHHLEVFIRRTFGDLFSTLLLLGYGEGAGRREASIRIPGGGSGSARGGRLIEVSGELPYGREPLVLAALLKLLLARVRPPAELDFDLPTVMAEVGWPETEVGWPETKDARGAVDDAIRKYLGLTYTVRRAGGDGAGSGMYALVTGYDMDDEIEAEGMAATRSLRRVHFHREFAEGLHDSRVVFAGIDFGPLRAGQ
jgi:hypothetical protein